MSLESEFISHIHFNDKGLVPAIAQDFETKAVLMLAWMNEQAVRQTVESGFATYFSRSRNKIWVKGEESGNSQQLVSIQADCDSDTLLLLVKQQGPACHTGNVTCFFEQGIAFGNEEMESNQ